MKTGLIKSLLLFTSMLLATLDLDLATQFIQKTLYGMVRGLVQLMYLLSTEQPPMVLCHTCRTHDLELRISRNEPSSNEDVIVSFIEINVM